MAQGKKTGDKAVADLSKDDVIQAGMDLIQDGATDGDGTDRALEAFEDLCLGLDTLQVKQVNTLIKLLLASRS